MIEMIFQHLMSVVPLIPEGAGLDLHILGDRMILFGVLSAY